MSDPTIFENLKVAFENHLYNLDNIEQKILITGRSDVLDMAIMSRTLIIRFVVAEQPDVPAEMILTASAKDLTDEILEVKNSEPACTLAIRFEKQVDQMDIECRQIEKLLKGLWEDDIRLTQTLSFGYPREGEDLFNRIEAVFKPRINEDNMGDIGGFLDSVIYAMKKLKNI